MSWLPIWGPSVLAVIVSAVFTLIFGWIRTRQHRQGIRALIAQEVLQNQTMLLGYKTSLHTCLEEGEPTRIASAFYSSSQPPRVQHARWDLSDVGESFGVAELTRLAEWYTKLEGLCFLHALTADMLTRLIAQNKAITTEQAQGIVEHLAGVLKYTESLLNNPPPLPDKRVQPSNKAMRAYLEDLQQRTASIE
ncbi:MAG: hypothetical protein ACRDID_20045 [Ktedonobacterales bacterium]